MGSKKLWDVTYIKTGSKYDSLNISLMVDTVELSYTPDVEEINHYHIALPRESVKVLYDWLREYLENED